MTTYTTIEQSEELLRLGLKPDTADMYYQQVSDSLTNEMGYKVFVGKSPSIEHNLFSFRNGFIIPCWSTGVLIDLLPTYTLECNELGMHKCVCTGLYSTNALNTSFDAVFEMICWLLKNNYMNSKIEEK